jgi:ferredoxin-thioredoxin reductase catalytic subunit
MEKFNEVAKEYKMKINSDEKIVEEVLDGLERTGGFCPCVPQANYNEATICPCKEMREGHKCRCGLYVKV